MKLNWNLAPYDGMMEAAMIVEPYEIHYTIYDCNDTFKLSEWAMQIQDLLIIRKPPYPHPKTKNNFRTHLKETEGFNYLIDAMEAAQESFNKFEFNPINS
jgi:hypothetical protein